MNETDSPTEPEVDPASDETGSQFGLLDVIEAFTAMRHEYRNQTKESRAVADGLNAASTQTELFTRRIETAIQELQQQIQRPQSTPAGDDEKRNTKLAVCLAEFDHMVSRSVDMATRSLVNQTGSDTPTASATERLGKLGPIARFFCRSFAAEIDQDRESDVQNIAEQRRRVIGNITAGLSMTTDHLRRQLTQHGIERIDVLGRPFDAETMRAVEVIDHVDGPPGHVAEQLSPAYRYNNRIILFADVRIAKPE